MGAGFDFLLEAPQLFVEVIGGGIDRHADGKPSPAPQSLARPVMPLVQASENAHQANRVHLINAAHLRVVTENGRVAGDGQDVAHPADRPGAEQHGLQADDVQVARGQVRDGFHAGLFEGPGEHDGVHPHAGQRSAVDVHGVHAPRSAEALHRLEDPIQVHPLRRVDLDGDGERSLLQLAIESGGGLGSDRFRGRRGDRGDGRGPAIAHGGRLRC